MKKISIHGKDYIQVNERIKEFHRLYSNGAIQTKVVEHENKVILMMAKVIPDVRIPDRFFTGYAQEFQGDEKSAVNKTSYIENCETSAVGRALGNLGIGIDDGFASADEVKIAQNKETKMPTDDPNAMTPKQYGMIKGLQGKLQDPEIDKFIEENKNKLTKKTASELIERMNTKSEEKKSEKDIDEVLDNYSV